jgi:hypothetical protein
VTEPTMANAHDDRSSHPDGDDQPEGTPLNERLLDMLVFVPAGIAVSVVEDFPKLAARGRERLGVRVSSARAVGKFAVKAGQGEFRRRSQGLLHRGGKPPDSRVRGEAARPSGTEGPGRTGSFAAPLEPLVRPVPSPGSAHVPPVTALSIPGFDTLSASQVVQRLDGLNRAELVSVRTYESSTRGRRTILSRVDQLLDERS